MRLLSLGTVAAALAIGNASAMAQTTTMPDFSARRAPADVVSTPVLPTYGIRDALDPRWLAGLFSVTANPAALAWEVGRSHRDYSVDRSFEDGRYRRVLDPPAAQTTTLEANGWQPSGSNGGMIGRVAIAQERFAPGPFADVVEPYSSNPFVTADTSSSPTDITSASMDGAGGWAIGNTAVGLTLGYQTREAHSVQAGFVRRNRSEIPGAILGLARRISLDTSRAAVALGISGGWRGGAETIDLLDWTQPGQVYELAGIAEPQGLAVSVEPYYHRFEQTSTFASASASVTRKSFRFSAGLQGARAEYRDWVVQTDNPPMNRWSPRSVRGDAGADYVSSFGVLQLRARVTTLEGAATLASDSVRTVFETHAHDAFASLSYRTPLWSAWAAAIAVSVEEMRHSRADTVAGIAADLQSRTPAVSASLGRWVAGRFFLESGFGLGAFTVRGAIPAARNRSAAYQMLVAPDLELYATPATQHSIHATLEWCAPGGNRLWVRGAASNASPDTRLPLTGFPPDGIRTSRSVQLGVTVAESCGPVGS